MPLSEPEHLIRKEQEVGAKGIQELDPRGRVSKDGAGI
jgi:hypothetical protein